MAVAAHGSATGKGGIWKSCTDENFCYDMHEGGLDFYFNSGAKANMQAAYYGYADKNWPAIQNMSAGKAYAPYCFNTNLVVTNSSTVDDDEA